MNVIHPLPYDDIKFDPPPPYESHIKANILSEYSLNVKITDKILIRINDNQKNIEYEKLIYENSKFWKQYSILFQNNYENFLKIMKLKFNDNIDLFHYSFELNEDKITFRILYQNFINGFDISFDIEKTKDKLELLNEIDSLKKQLIEQNNDLLINNFIIEENKK
tara:strand:+ start:392 stop:886 length:495 start_codon:yes stop_codon:yes gene_type:complete